MSKTPDYHPHPAAELFPLMDGATFAALKTDIEANGQREPVVYWCGQLLDGRNRLRACEELGIEPFACELDKDVDPIKYVLSTNLHRRHLTESQRAMVAGKLANLERGGDRKSESFKGSIDTLIDDAAELLNVSPASVKRAKTVLSEGSADLIAAVESGEVKVSKAASVAKTTPKNGQVRAAKKKPKPATDNSSNAPKSQGVGVQRAHEASDPAEQIERLLPLLDVAGLCRVRDAVAAILQGGGE